MDNQINPHVAIGVKLITDALTDQELAAIYMAATAGFDPRHVMGYEKAKGLFTMHDGTKMHSDTLAAFGSIVSKRLP